MLSNPKDDFGADTDRGSFYVFRRSAGVWSQVQKAVPGDAVEGDLFGHSRATDGQHVLVGAMGWPLGTLAGSAYFFERDAQTWVEQQKVVASDFAPGLTWSSRRLTSAKNAPPRLTIRVARARRRPRSATLRPESGIGRA